MSKLAAFLAKLAEKAEALEQAKAQNGNESEDESSEDDEDVSHSKHQSVYGSKTYWEERYSEGVVGDAADKGELSNEWFLSYAALKDSFSNHLERDKQVVILGNGLSLLGEEMADDGFQSVSAIDYSETCTERMRSWQGSKAAFHGSQKQDMKRTPVDYQVMDVTRLSYPDNSVASVVDKATLDTMYNADDELLNVHLMLSEVHRVLHPGGKYVVVSYGDPEDRLPALLDTAKGYMFTLKEQKELKKNKASFHLYVLQKKAEAVESREVQLIKRVDNIFSRISRLEDMSQELLLCSRFDNILQRIFFIEEHVL